MRLDDMIPYERNAWDNQAGVPAIAESIREFGFRGKIKLRSREDPVIVSGHHRVMALKSLGWEELPDEHIEFCDDLTDEEVAAFRLADNKVVQGGRWNRALEREEVRRLAGKVDMGRFNFDFKSKARPYGAERLRTDDAYNLREVNASHCAGPLDMPVIEPVDFTPTALLPFNYAKTAEEKAQTLHFFIDDYQFERLWASPAKYLDLALSFEAVLTPDFSLTWTCRCRCSGGTSTGAARSATTGRGTARRSSRRFRGQTGEATPSALVACRRAEPSQYPPSASGAMTAHGQSGRPGCPQQSRRFGRRE